MLRSAWLRPFNDLDMVEDLISPFGLLWSPTRLRARIAERREETPDAITLRLQPNGHWKGFVAGQHVGVEVIIDARRLVRSYSISSDPADTSSFTITVKRQSEGKVSNWLHAHAAVGDLLGLQPPEGDFTLPQQLPRALLMISAGSGVTPLHAMLFELARRHYRGDIEFVHVCRDENQAILRSSIERLQQRLPGLSPRWLQTSVIGRPSNEELLSRVPDYAQRLTLMCGPAGLMRPIIAKWKAEGIAERLRIERFGMLGSESDAAAASFRVACLGSGREFSASTSGTLLPAAEQAGLAPRYGCRAGICHTCRYRKRSGRVENLLTGLFSEEPGEMIQLCICAPRSDIELEDL